MGCGVDTRREIRHHRVVVPRVETSAECRVDLFQCDGFLESGLAQGGPARCGLSTATTQSRALSEAWRHGSAKGEAAQG